MKSNNIILIGMSGAGKSTLGVLLAKALGKQFCDTDLLIQERAGALLQQIIDREGNAAFLKLEEETILDASLTNCVVATGGSVVYSDAVMRDLKKSGTVVFLDVSYEEIAARLTSITTRGIVFRNAQDLRGVYEERLPLYRKYADIRIPCTGHSIEDSVFELVARLTSHQSQKGEHP